MATMTELTDRQLEMAKLAAQGQTLAEIAEEMQVSMSAVRQHLDAVKRKLGINRKSQIASALHEEGLL